VKSGSTNELAKRTDWERWVLAHAPGLLLFARQQSRCEADAQDLVQEAVVEAWQRQADDAPPPLPLVFATIRRRAADWGRSQDRRAAREAAAHAEAPECWFDTSIEDRERSRLIEEAMRKLQADYREVITLKTWGGLTFAQIAEALEIPANTAASRYRYGLEELRRVLSGEALVESLRS
jgi:RNA polymerase sigma-70 factor, ECF subfamily